MGAYLERTLLARRYTVFLVDPTGSRTATVYYSQPSERAAAGAARGRGAAGRRRDDEEQGAYRYQQFLDSMVDLTAIKLAEYTAAFNSFDEQKCGSIPCSQFTAVLHYLQIEPNDDEIARRFKDLGLTEDGKLDLATFLELMKDEYAKEIKQAFELFDKANNGYISEADFKATLREFNQPHSDAEIQRMFEEADIDDDKTISFEEFEQAYHNLL